jgi:predicted NAD-dependent protein-ADP-ribosyltransferase YbiA (DUF1768 family)
MVKSILVNTIDYKENREIESADLDFDANLYETKFYNVTSVFALGSPNFTYIDNGLVLYPIYLVENDEIKMQIGLYEILATQQPNLTDADGDIDLNKFDKPLLYKFAYTVLVGEKAPAAAAAATKKSTKATAPGAKKNKGTNKDTNKGKNKWIQNFLENPDYDIIDTKPDGHCFFEVLQIALHERGQTVSIDDMREILSKNINEELFQGYKNLYEDFKAEEQRLSGEIKNITARFNALNPKIKATKDRNLQLSFITQSDEMQKRHKELLNQRNNLKGTLKEFEFMKDIDNLSMLKLKIKTKEYWADTWAISTLERELNIKTIIFSELHYLEGDEMNVLQCGQLNDTILEVKGKFEPSFYVLVCYQGVHYQLVTYDDQKSFLFAELPEEIKNLVADKCLEKMAGPYSLIPDFVEYNLAQKTQGPIMPQEAQAAEEKSIMGDLPSDLYDNATVFRFYNKSRDAPLPGKGEGEHLGPEGTAAYEKLAKIPQWRKKLDNFWPAEFILDRHRWFSVEHYYQAAKYKKRNKEFYLQFSLDTPDSALARDAAMAKGAGGKTGKFKGEQVRPKNIEIDLDFLKINSDTKKTRGEMELEEALRAKFTQNADLKQLLIHTKKAKLEHVATRKPATVFNELMRVRRELQAEI